MFVAVAGRISLYEGEVKWEGTGREAEVLRARTLVNQANQAIDGALNRMKHGQQSKGMDTDATGAVLHTVPFRFERNMQAIP